MKTARGTAGPEAERHDPVSTFSSPTIFRKAACACGGGCSSCQAGKHASPATAEIGDQGPSMTARRERSGNAPERVPISVMAAVNSPGKMLPDPLRRTAERHFEKDLSHIRLHDDPLAATAVAESRAHALSIGNDILLSRGRSDFSRPTSQKTLAHEIAHALQPASTQSSHFEPDGSAAETEASAAAESFISEMDLRNRPAMHRPRNGVVRERDPRLDSLVELVDAMPLVLTSSGIAEQLNRGVPGLDIDDPDNSEPLRFLLNERFGPGAGNDAIAEWRALRSAVSVSESPPQTTAHTSTSEPAAPAVEVVSAVPPASMTGTELENEIDLLRTTLGMRPLNEDAPTSDPFEPRDSDDQRRFDRLTALETEYFARRRLLERARAVTAANAREQRSEGDGGISDALLPIPAGIAMTMELFGNPVEDFVIGFVPGFLGGALLELPRDVFTRLDDETHEHPFRFTGGIFVGIPVGAAQGLWDMIVGLAELLQLVEAISPSGLTRTMVEEAVLSTSDEHRAQRVRQFQKAQEIGEAIVAVIVEMIRDPAFMLVHGEELGEIAGRAAGQWFSTDFMEMSTFQKGYLIGRIEGRILFEVVALFLGPEEWLARGATLIGEGARISARLSHAIIEFIEHIPALRRLLTAGREAATVAREAVASERVLAETGEAVSEASRLGDEASDVTRAGERAADDVAGPARTGTADEAAAASRTLPDSISGCRIGSLFCPIDELLGREEFQEHLVERRRFFDYVGEFEYTDLDLGPSPRSLERVRIETGDAMYRQYFEVFEERGTEPFQDAMQQVWRQTAREGVDYRRLVIDGHEYRWPLQNGEPWTVHHEPPLEFIGFEDSALWRPMPLTIHDDVHRWWTGFRRSVLSQVPPELRRAVVRGNEAFDIREFVR